MQMLLLWVQCNGKAANLWHRIRFTQMANFFNNPCHLIIHGAGTRGVAKGGGRAYSAPPDPITGFKGPTSKGKGEGLGRGWGGEGWGRGGGGGNEPPTP